MAQHPEPGPLALLCPEELAHIKAPMLTNARVGTLAMKPIPRIPGRFDRARADKVGPSKSAVPPKFQPEVQNFFPERPSSAKMSNEHAVDVGPGVHDSWIGLLSDNKDPQTRTQGRRCPLCTFVGRARSDR